MPESMLIRSEFETRWGMVIDIDKCTGCGACVVACQAENNIPPSPDPFDPLRTIHWIRIYKLSNNRAYPHQEIAFMPRPCMQCANPPCVPVCPVTATTKDEEGGIVSQIHPRCLGCRYCLAACPYQARVFNWFDPTWPQGMEQTLNPAVSARPRGVVEKCTFCHHRFQAAKQLARSEDRDPHNLREGDYVPACVQACPTGAMVFGDLNNQTHRVAQLADTQRAFRLLERLGTNPQVFYLSSRSWVRKQGDNLLEEASQKGA